MTRPMDPNSKASRCLAALRDGPAIATEVAAELEISAKLAGVHLMLLERRGKVKRSPKPYVDPETGRSYVQWELKA